MFSTGKHTRDTYRDLRLSLNVCSHLSDRVCAHVGHSTESGQIGDWKSKIFNIGKFIEIVMYFQDIGMDR